MVEEHCRFRKPQSKGCEGRRGKKCGQRRSRLQSVLKENGLMAKRGENAGLLRTCWSCERKPKGKEISCHLKIVIRAVS
jgi:hypothetical protein